MRDAILSFPKQFEYQPKIENAEALRKAEKFVVCGMGGSHLAAGILQTIRPDLHLIIHRDYGLPNLPEQTLQKRLIILSSYSGNTEEVIEAFGEALQKELNMIAISIGGKLIELAKEHKVPYIQMPDTGIQPRSALGYSFKALLKAMDMDLILSDTGLLAGTLRPPEFESQGKTLAERARGRVPVIYSSARNLAVAYNWKIKLNETGKIPAFYNVFPELNHNEMTGFDVKPATKSLSEKFFFIFLKDKLDHPSVTKRMEIMKKLYEDRGLPVEVMELSGESVLHGIFSSLLIADWFALHTAENYGVESEQVPMVEEFKKLIA